MLPIGKELRNLVSAWRLENNLNCMFLLISHNDLVKKLVEFWCLVCLTDLFSFY